MRVASTCTRPTAIPSHHVTQYWCPYCAVASRLAFKERMWGVTQTALQPIKSMKRDWIQTGRRPPGGCGAALLIAAHVHGARQIGCKTNIGQSRDTSWALLRPWPETESSSDTCCGVHACLCCSGCEAMLGALLILNV